jgi:hypothetical protein
VPYSQIANLDYLEIKESLKTYLRSQSEFTDYDFEGSALSNILDVLSYNTYYTAFNTNLVANEFFIDSATLRDNVIRIAKQLGYRPRSRVAPKSTINFTATITSNNPPASYTLRKGTGFLSNFDDTVYKYVVIDDVTVPVTNGVATFEDVEISEGTLIKQYFTFDSSTDNRFVLSNIGIDSSSIRVVVYQNQNSSSKFEFKSTQNILEIDSQSKVYFIEEIDDENYQIIFGDGVFGAALDTGNYIEVSYLITAGPESNGVSSFRFNGILSDDDNNTYSTTVVVSDASISDGGAEIESTDSIKFIAPKYFGTQNRAVTAEDFKPIISKIYPNVSDIIVYGGEEEQPPEYGVVKLVIKPKNSAKLTSQRKREIESELEQYMVGSVTPKIIDPSILYVEVNSTVFYNRLQTNLTSKDITTKVINSLESYVKLSETEKFSGKLRYSKVNGVIDAADDSIQSNETSFVMRKDIQPILNTTTFYEVCYQNEFDKECNGPTVSSTGFVVSEYPRFTVYIKDVDGIMVLYRIGSSGDDIILKPNVGTVDYVAGEVKLYDLTIIRGTLSNNIIQLRTIPLKRDVFAFREQYLDVDINNSKIFAQAE